MEKYLKAALSQAQAKARQALFTASMDNIRYTLFLKLRKGESYDGDVTIDFDLQRTSSDLFLDFAGTQIHHIFVNGTRVHTNDDYESLRDRRFLKIPHNLQVVGKNEVKIRFSNVYSNDGIGLTSFIDTDGKQFLYSQCEPYGANKVFPCFDQPNLKATLSLVVSVPNDWIAIGNQPVIEQNEQGQEEFPNEDQHGYNIVAFKTTLRLSTYLFAFIAGPYHEIKSQKVHNGITMSCYCRESLLEYMKDQAEEIFEITLETIKFYESYFNYPYPFEKYDYIFCPEYKFDAMENPGAVTFDDRYIWREEVIQDQNTLRAIYIAHECAHHWFGDLVTMDWWNDLWLNESFAEYISHYCLYNIKDKVKTTTFADVWLAFLNGKGWGYEDDQKVSTHPIAGEVLDTDQAESIFDGITYSKGAASLKQLMGLIGEENFGRAMGSYFKTYEWSNATLNDFIEKLQDFYLSTFPGSPENLNAWKAEWLQTAGLNECEPVFNPEDHSGEAKLVIKQSVALACCPCLRHHKMKVAFFGDEGQIVQEKDIMLNNASETVITYNGSLKPKAVKLNYQDETFIKVRLDEQSIAFLRKKLHGVPCELTRAMIWRSLFDMVNDGKLSAAKFVEVALEAFPSETSDSTLNNILNYVADSFKYSPRNLNENVLKPRLFDRTLALLLSTDKSNTNRIVLLKESLIKFASFGEERRVDNCERLLSWLDETDSQLKDFPLEVKDKWAIVELIHAYPKISDLEKVSYFNKVADLDSSDRMRLAEQRCEALRADDVEREKLFASYLDPENKLSVHKIQQSMNGYSRSLRNTAKDEEAFFEHVFNIFETRNNPFSQSFYHNLFPDGENLAYYIERVTQLIGRATNNYWLSKCLKDSLDLLERKINGFKCSALDL